MNSFSIKSALAEIHRSPLYRHPSSYMWKNSLSINSQFCDAVVTSGYLTFEQMVNASCRYCLGATKSRGVIFWQIDREGRIHDGKVMWYGADCHRLKSKKPTWVSALLRLRNAGLRSEKGIVKSEKSKLPTFNMNPTDNTNFLPPAPCPSPLKQVSSHCFFGLHLLTDCTDHTDFLKRKNHSIKGYSKISAISFVSAGHSEIIALVESEKSAFILSELYPEYIWLASGGLGEAQPNKFRPLRGHRVILFPDTDPEGIAYKRWYDAAQLVMHQPFWEESPPIRVSPLLEMHATEEQKQRKIDLVDFLFPNVNPNCNGYGL